MRFGLIGAGLIGRKRAEAVAVSHTLVSVCDAMPERAAGLAASFGAQTAESPVDLLTRSDIDAVVVATTHDSLADLAIQALRAGKHVLVEKPAGRHPNDLQRLVAAEAQGGPVLRIGFNHRFHPAFQKLKQLAAHEDWGNLLYIRARYGHGGRVGYEREWRADRSKSGGGELMDQGVHLIDLCRWIGGEFALKWGTARTFFWNMEVEDNGFLLLESPDGKRSAFLHASCTEWKNLFDFEVFYRRAKAEVWGLGRSYGEEELRVYRMKPEMGPPDLETFRFPGDDLSWREELEAFVQEIEGRHTALATAQDAWRAVSLVHQVYG